MKIVSKRHPNWKPTKFEKIVLPMITKIVPNMIASELVSVQPMSTNFNPLPSLRYEIDDGCFYAPYVPLLERKPKKTILKSKRHPDTIAAQKAEMIYERYGKLTSTFDEAVKKWADIYKVEDEQTGETWASPEETDAGWKHVCVTRSNDETKTYVDGVQTLKKLHDNGTDQFLSRRAMLELAGFTNGMAELVDEVMTERGQLTHAQEISLQTMADAKLPAEEAQRLLKMVSSDEVITGVDLRVPDFYDTCGVQYVISSTKPYSYF